MTVPRPLAAFLLLTAGAAHAHSGHGIPQAWHWHSTDTVGFVMVAALAAIAIWYSGKK